MKLKKADFPRVAPGQWVQPARSGYQLACCDCGLVHTMDFRLLRYGNGKTKIQFRAFRSEATTKALRTRNQMREMPECRGQDRLTDPAAKERWSKKGPHREQEPKP